MFQLIRNRFRSGVLALLLFVCAAATGQAQPSIDGAAMHRIGMTENLCALTFDDGPSKHTERLLDILAAHNIKATFFVIGERASRNPNTMQRMIREGHEIANHTYSHKSLRHMPEAQQAHEIGKVQDVLENYGVKATLLRPPFGRYDAVTQRILDRLGMRVALWSADSHDWQRRASIENIQSVYSTPARTGVILFHDTHQPTVDAMDEILIGLEAGQCRFVTMSEFFAVADARLSGKPLPEGHMPATTPSVSHPKQAAPPPASQPEPPAENSFWSLDGVFDAVRNWARSLMDDPAPDTANIDKTETVGSLPPSAGNAGATRVTATAAHTAQTRNTRHVVAN